MSGTQPKGLGTGNPLSSAMGRDVNAMSVKDPIRGHDFRPVRSPRVSERVPEWNQTDGVVIARL